MTLCLTAEWRIAPAHVAQVLAALPALVAAVEQESGVLQYLWHTPSADILPAGWQPQLQDTHSLFLLAEFCDSRALLQHLQGAAFSAFLREHGDCFLGLGQHPWHAMQCHQRRAGFVRDAAGAPVRHGASDSGRGSSSGSNSNRHPAVMFEVIAKDQAQALHFYQQVFGWEYQTGTGGFAYVHFPPSGLPHLGGIGQADPAIPGFAPGHSFYLLVDDVSAALARGVAAGGCVYMEKTTIDGYTFGMLQDPEGNPFGVIEPFAG